MRSLLLLFCLLLSPVMATEYRSGPDQGILLELYTSQGCSSCPPADDWLATLTDHPALWRTLYPVALHVDYWNYLGWSDPGDRWLAAMIRAQDTRRDPAQSLDQARGSILGKSNPWLVSSAPFTYCRVCFNACFRAL